MTWRKSPLNLFSLAALLSLSLWGTLAFPTRSRANTAPPSGAIAQELPTDWNAAPFDPPQSGAPGRRIGGATRGLCPESAQNIVALIPPTNQGQTLSQYPTFFFYVPEIVPAQDMQIEFLLEDQSNWQDVKTVYKTTMPIPKQSGIVAIALPDNGESEGLAVDKIYNWYFSVICDYKSSEPHTLSTGGWIERVATPNPLARELEMASATEKVEIYQRERLWYDLLGTLAQLQSESADNSSWSAQWQQLLDAVELEDIANAPLVELSFEPVTP
ncbi:DUF928 domain-containing protein [Oxynema sp. CENA135]|uniref:DUF928 domain-containing protein n=1 Tax=Oxynema sp. CENA135 TaxID=984206 RepID=UPI001909C4BC|nr:DUF928 domain-containing protein [Oxynema sp. CENA135]